MNRYLEDLWKKSIQNEYQLEGHAIAPIPSTQKLQIEKNTLREDEILLMSFFYENNLMNKFLFRYNPDMFTSPLCDCGNEDQTPHHLLFRCSLTDNNLRTLAYSNFQKGVGHELAQVDSTITLLNASRKPEFLQNILNILKSIKHRLRTDIVI